MHKVERNKAPDELVAKSTEYRKDFKNKNANEEWGKFEKTKLKKTTLEQLEKMYGGCCAYCEGIPAPTSYPAIDHFKPKSLFPELCFEYNNMNYSCTKCNTNKSNTWSDNIINPSAEDPEEHILYIKTLATSKSEKGKYAIDLFKLNDNNRMADRNEKYKIIEKRIQNSMNAIKLVNSKNKETRDIVIGMLKENIEDIKELFKHGKSYSTMCRHNFEDEVMTLEEIVEKIDA